MFDTLADNEEDVGPVMLIDWYHPTYEQIVENVMAPFTTYVSF